MQISSEHLHLELRVLELEDTVKVLTKVASSLNEMMGTLNEISKTHTRVLTGLLGASESTKDDDTPPWQAHTP
jgi:hypothetical protein